MTTTATRSEATPSIRGAGVVLITGALLMIIGAIINRVTGADLDAALDEGAITGYLTEAAAARAALFANLSLWIAGSFFLGIGGYLLSHRRNDTVSRFARGGFLVGPALAMVSFVTWMALVRMAGSDPATALADTLGFVSSRVDWIATILLVGLGPMLLSIAGKDDWVPRWLYGLGLLAGVASVLTVIAMYGGGLTTYGFLIVPVGLIWVISASVVAMKRGGDGS